MPEQHTRTIPVLTVHDASSHAMAWIAFALGVPQVPLGVDDFGQSGSVADIYELHDMLPGSIVNAGPLQSEHLTGKTGCRQTVGDTGLDVAGQMRMFAGVDVPVTCEDASSATVPRRPELHVGVGCLGGS